MSVSVIRLHIRTTINAQPVISIYACDPYRNSPFISTSNVNKVNSLRIQFCVVIPASSLSLSLFGSGLLSPVPSFQWSGKPYLHLTFNIRCPFFFNEYLHTERQKKMRHSTHRPYPKLITNMVRPSSSPRFKPAVKIQNNKREYVNGGAETRRQPTTW